MRPDPGRRALPASIGRRGGPLTRWLGRAILRRLGWTIEGDLPDHPRIVAVVAPHSSNLDFLIAIGLVFCWNLRVRFIGKKELFWFPLGLLLKWLGGIPVDRGASRGFVEQVVTEIQRSPSILLGMAPEGTRTFGAKWKTGFYRIARQADAIVLPVYLDWGRRVIGLLPPPPYSDDPDRDLAGIVGLFARFPRKDGRTIDVARAVG
ncbi:MAG: glycerol acyltransferase [Gemmatimonadetes bacterium]|nr:glycerol acyltransferase [Gemmatimonadota bacterium]